MSKKRKLDASAELFACPICLDRLCLPVLCNSCGQCMCENCLVQWIGQNEHPKCPLCNIPEMRFSPCRLLSEFLSNGTLYCPFRKKGCHFSNSSSEMYKLHLSECTFRNSECSTKNCPWQGDFVQLQQHETQCVWKQVPSILTEFENASKAAEERIQQKFSDLAKQNALLELHHKNAIETLQYKTSELRMLKDMLLENCSDVFLTPFHTTTQSLALYYYSRNIMLPLFIDVSEDTESYKCRVYLGAASKSKLNFPCLALGYYISYNTLRKGRSCGRIETLFTNKDQVKLLFKLELENPAVENHLKFNLLLRIY